MTLRGLDVLQPPFVIFVAALAGRRVGGSRHVDGRLRPVVVAEGRLDLFARFDDRDEVMRLDDQVTGVVPGAQPADPREEWGLMSRCRDDHARNSNSIIAVTRSEAPPVFLDTD